MYVRGTTKGKLRMSYALFAMRKQVLDSELNCAQLQQTQRSNEQYAVASNKAGLQQQLSSLTASFGHDMRELYGRLSSASDSDERASIQAEVDAKKEELNQATDKINLEIYEVSMIENSIEMEVKRLDTIVGVLKKQLEAVQQAEGPGINEATPKFAGLQ